MSNYIGDMAMALTIQKLKLTDPTIKNTSIAHQLRLRKLTTKQGKEWSEGSIENFLGNRYKKALEEYQLITQMEGNNNELE